MAKQTTIAKEVSFEGVGLHTGKKCKIVFKPASENTGIHFIRVDLPNKPDIKADWNSLSTEAAIRGTTIQSQDVKIHTIEHILSAFYGLQIDNVIVEIDNNEPPILDGSAKLFCDKILEVGIKELNADKEFYVIKEPITFTAGNTKIVAYPSDKFEIDCTIGYEHPFLSNQQAKFEINKDVFVKDIALARTFCFDYEIEALQSNGLAKGGSLDNAIVIGPNGIYNKEPLRFSDEFVRHKILDLIGDVSLAGKQIKARIVAQKPGHKSNVSFIKEFVSKALIDKGEPKVDVPKKEEQKADNEDVKVFNSAEIQKIIPHRYPILMIDRVLIVEAMARTSCVMFLSRPTLRNCLAYFMGIDKVKFRRTVIPGDVLELRVEVIRDSGRKGKVRGEAYVDGKLVTEAEFMFIIVDREK